MRSSIQLITKHDVSAPMRAVEPLHVLASAAILFGIVVAVLASVEAMGAPLAGWASVQTLASLAPV
jgi:hypothetical protein